ncbi:MAG: hypothetical protein EOO39_34725 [Cytophagaceae bacterium]|nr:MAG: hypothetical protein EOO39_34725 [Cytophagaceae bacterium]
MYWALPKYFYKRRIGWLTFIVLLLFWGLYLLNRTAIFSVEPSLPKSSQYITRIQSIIGPTGLFGCFLSLRVFLWNFAFALVAPLIPLSIKIMQETMVFRQKQFDLKRNRLLLDRDNTLLKMNFLKAQVSPHFLFNTLNSIYSRMIDVDDQAADLVLKLAELMRYNLYEANVPRVPLNREMDYLMSYVTLEQARHGDQLTVSFNSSGATTGYLIAPLVLSAFVENAFKHGIKSAAGGAYILIDAHLERNVLHFVVENSLHRKLALTTVRRSGGVGLSNVHKRLDIQYSGRYTVTHDITDDRYRVVLQLELDAASEKVGSDPMLAS